MSLLPLEIWTKRAKEHEALVRPFADEFVKRRDEGRKHPVYDFLFLYYPFSPLKLKQWVPSLEMSLAVTEEILVQFPWLKNGWFQVTHDTLRLNREAISEKTLASARFIASLCSNILDKPGRFNCHGLHEWAMVYKCSQASIRHQETPLRLSQEALNQFVESQRICCSHYDAYRFFTPEAKPLNLLTPLFSTRLEMEQGGCVHANMDLYKWSSKLWPWIGSDFIAKAFLLACEGRILDMRASPYDLREVGFEPICIETEEGRWLYCKEQRQYAERALLLRQELLKFCHNLYS